MESVVVLSGAGISAESGLKTFRDNDGLWENHRVEDVATPEAWHRNPSLVLRFYNERRRQLYEVEPNAAHRALAELEEFFDVTIVTQNVDDLHERAGSSSVLHLHGELDVARSSENQSLRFPLQGKPIEWGDLCPLGSQLRPDVVWFGESVPMLEPASKCVERADFLIVVGTALAVYPAANLAFFAPSSARKYVVNPEIPESVDTDRFDCRSLRASVGVPELVSELIAEVGS